MCEPYDHGDEPLRWRTCPKHERQLEERPKLTADTITDEQIRDLRKWLEQAQLDAGFAIMDPDPTPPRAPTLRAEIMKARARCAEILNARAEGK